MQSPIFAIAFVFLVMFGGLTLSVIVRDGLTPITAVAVLVIVLMGIGILGAFLDQPPDD